MAPSLLILFFYLHSQYGGFSHRAADFRQAQLEEGILHDDKAEIAEAMTAGANPNRSIAFTPLRLQTLKMTSVRASHYFAEEPKATPLMLAAALGQAQTCKLLINQGAARFAFSSWGWVAAQYAAKCGYPEIAQSLFNSDPLASHFRIRIGIIPQTVVLYKDGAEVIRGKISTGRPGFDTPPGNYLVTDKERDRRSSIYKVPMPYFMRLSFSEYGIHQGFNPGRPASHGCIRVGKENVAKAIWEQTPIGTLVVIE